MRAKRCWRKGDTQVAGVEGGGVRAGVKTGGDGRSPLSKKMLLLPKWADVAVLVDLRALTGRSATG